MKKIVCVLGCLVACLLTLPGCSSDDSIRFKSVYIPSLELSVSLGMKNDDLTNILGVPAHISSENGIDEFYIYYDQDYNKVSFLFSEDMLRSIYTYSPQYETFDGIKPGTPLTELGAEWSVTNYGATVEHGVRVFDKDGQTVAVDQQERGNVIHRLDIIDNQVVCLAFTIVS